MTTSGLLLAAGAGRRMGMPKALVRDDDGTPWLTRSVQVLREGGCDRVVVVLGAGADEAEPLLDGLDGVSTVRSEDWSSGMGASLATGLAALDEADTEAALVHLVDLPDVTAEVVARVLATATSSQALARASYDGRPGHPVLIGRDHWLGVITSATGDQGARTYLASHEVTLVECGDLASGADVDRR
ncbi:NTP transferase domain-containing protein [Nocardioides kongjuensis]|uniref:CTP:molybdopterin cytidylyltransferase MocA n=1 Tax=Nocardioides kongjuensis TaxID=349522 RepID=A0A852RY31_9ACTN|nr:CTP:molybdopterin cytidylyltransferase MocA [Nocardioides kongjuensis]